VRREEEVFNYFSSVNVGPHVSAAAPRF
jgi:hypothetical protein